MKCRASKVLKKEKEKKGMAIAVKPGSYADIAKIWALSEIRAKIKISARNIVDPSEGKRIYEPSIIGIIKEVLSNEVNRLPMKEIKPGQ